MSARRRYQGRPACATGTAPGRRGASCPRSTLTPPYVLSSLLRLKKLPALPALRCSRYHRSPLPVFSAVGGEHGGPLGGLTPAPDPNAGRLCKDDHHSPVR